MVAPFGSVGSAAPVAAAAPTGEARHSVVSTPSMLRLLAVASAAALICAVSLSPEQAADGPVVCPFRLLTGLPCPGCGMTRAWVFAMHGQLRPALAANPFVVVALPAAIALIVGVAVAAVRRRQPPDVRPILSSLAVRLVLIAWVGFGVLRAAAVLTGRISG